MVTLDDIAADLAKVRTVYLSYVPEAGDFNFIRTVLLDLKAYLLVLWPDFNSSQIDKCDQYAEDAKVPSEGQNDQIDALVSIRDEFDDEGLGLACLAPLNTVLARLSHVSGGQNVLVDHHNAKREALEAILDCLLAIAPPVVPLYLFAGLFTIPGVLVRCVPGSLTRKDSLTLNVGDNEVLALAQKTGQLYASTACLKVNSDCSYRSKVAKVDPSLWSEVGDMDTDADHGCLGHEHNQFCVDDEYLYFPTDGCPAGPERTLMRVRKVDLSYIDDVAIFTFCQCSARKEQYVYVASFDSPPTISKVNVLTMSVVETLTLDEGDDPAYCLLVDGNYLYVGGFWGSIYKIDLVHFKRDDVAQGSGYPDFPVTDLEMYEGYLYASVGTSPGIIDKINPTAMTVVDTLTLGDGEDEAECLERVGTKLYAGCRTFPGIIAEVDLTTFSEASALTLNPGEDKVMDLLYGPLPEPEHEMKTGFNWPKDAWLTFTGSSQRPGETFTAPQTFTLSKIRILTNRDADLCSGSTVFAEIYETSGGLPTGSPISTGSIPYDALTAGAVDEWKEIPMSPVELQRGVSYGLIVYNDCDLTYQRWGFHNGNLDSPSRDGYPDGRAIYSDDGGGTWGFLDEWWDFLFEVWR